jgi:hypothetical protein
MTPSEVLFVSIFCILMATPLLAAKHPAALPIFENQSAGSADKSDAAASRQTPANTPQSTSTQSTSTGAAAKTAASPTSSGTAKRRRKKKTATNDCNALASSSGHAASGSSSSHAATKGSAAGNASSPEASSSSNNCPPSKVIVRQGGTSDPSIELAGGTAGTQASQQRNTANQMLGTTEENLKKIAGRQLSADQQEMLNQIRQFMDQSKAAVGDGDLDRARTLAWKAQVLSEELVKPTK